VAADPLANAIRAVVEQEPACRGWLAKLLTKCKEAGLLDGDVVQVVQAIQAVTADWDEPPGHKDILAEVTFYRQEPEDVSTPGADEKDDKQPPAWMKKGTDVYMAWRFAAQHRGRLVYCKLHKTFYVWSGKWWQRDDDDHALNLAIETAEQVAKEYLARATELEAHLREKTEKGDNKVTGQARKELQEQLSGCRRGAKRAQDYNHIRKFMTIAQADRRIAVRPTVFDQEPNLLACGNGTVDLSCGKLLPHDPKHMITRGTEVPFLSNGDLLDQKAVTLWHEVLDHMATGTPYKKPAEGEKPKPDPKLRDYYQLIMGNSLYGHNELEKFYMLWGEAGSCKGTAMEGVKAALGGDLAMTAESKSFVQEKQYRVRDDLQRLNGTRIVIASEQDRGEKLAASVLNQIAGGDTLVSRMLYSKLEEHRATFTLMMELNNLPYVDWTEVGLKRRAVVVPMGKALTDDQRDPKYKRILHDPKRGGPVILAWLVAGAVRTYQTRRIQEPVSVQKATGKYWAEMDRSWEFVSEVLRFEKVGSPDWERTFALVDDISTAYAAWCKRRQMPERYRLSASRLRDRLVELGGDKKKTSKTINGSKVNRWYWLGLTIASGAGYDNRCSEATHEPTQKASDKYLEQFRPDIGTDGTRLEHDKPAAASDLQERFQGSSDQAQPLTCARTRAEDFPDGAGTLEPWNLQDQEERKEEREEEEPAPWWERPADPEEGGP